MDDKPAPKKPRKKRTSKPPTQEAPSPTPQVTAMRVLPLSPEENEMFLKQINEFLKKKDPPSKDTNYDYKILQSNVGEFLESYILFGYNFHGQRVVIQNYPSPRDKDALLEFLKNIFIANTSKDISLFDDE